MVNRHAASIYFVDLRLFCVVVCLHMINIFAIYSLQKRRQRYKFIFIYASARGRARENSPISVNFYTIYLVFAIFCSTFAAETIRVMRFVPVGGAKSEVAINSLQKVVFTPDSVVLNVITYDLTDW